MTECDVDFIEAVRGHRHAGGVALVGHCRWYAGQIPDNLGQALTAESDPKIEVIAAFQRHVNVVRGHWLARWYAHP